MTRAVAAIEARKKLLRTRAEIVRQVNRGTKRPKKAIQSKAATRDIFTKGRRLKGSGWAGKGQR